MKIRGEAWSLVIIAHIDEWMYLKWQDEHCGTERVYVAIQCEDIEFRI